MKLRSNYILFMGLFLMGFAYFVIAKPGDPLADLLPMVKIATWGAGSLAFAYAFREEK